MLLGTTFAWFTDSVSSGVNNIIAGNLDIEVYHNSASVTTPTSIKSETELFRDANGNAMLWEPGAVSYETFTVKNEGTLALKYKLAMNILDYNALDGHTLKEVLKVKVLAGNEMLATIDRTTVSSLDWSTTDTLDVFNTAGSLEAGESDIFQVIIYWAPGANDNNFNMNNGKATSDGQPLFINFGINVVASQLNFENDSFGPDYDQGIALPDLPVSVNKVFQSAPIAGDSVSESVTVKNVSTNVGVATVQAASVNAVIGALKNQATDMAAGSDLSTIIYLNVQTADKSETSVTYEIGMYATLTYKDIAGATQTTTLSSLNNNLADKIVTATMEIGKGLSNVTVKHHGTPMTQLAPDTTDAEGYYYNKTTGVLTIKSKSFSPFTVDYTIEGVAVVGNTTYSTLEDAINAAENGNTVVLLKDVTLTSDLQLGGNGKSLTLHLNNHTIDGGEYQIYTAGVGTITICGGGTIKNTNATQNADYAPLRIYQYSSVVLDDVTINGVYCAVKNSGNLTVKKANITGTTFGLGCFLDGTTVIGQLGGNNSDIVVTAKEQALATAAATGYAAMNVTVYSGTFTSSGTVWDDCPVYWAGHGTLNVYGGTFQNNTSGTEAAGLYQKNGVVNIYGGNFISRCGIKLGAEETNSTEITLNVYGGTITGAKHAALYYKTTANGLNCTTYNVNISGGQFTGDTSKGAIYKSCVTGVITPTVSITGGTFSTDPSTYVADGKMAVQNSEGMYEVVNDPRVKTEEELKAAVEAGGEVTLGADITLTSSLVISKDLILNLGEFKLTGKEKSNAVVISAESGVVHVTINATSGGIIGQGSNGNCIASPLYNDAAVDLTINGGNYESLSAYFIEIANRTAGSKVVINGGEFSGKKVMNIVPQNAEILIKNGSFSGTESGIVFGTNSTNSKFTMTGGEIVMRTGKVITMAASGNLVEISGTASLTGDLSLSKGTMNIYGGTVSLLSNEYSNQACRVMNGATLNISGDAKIQSQGGFLISDGTINISGGSFKGKIATQYYTSDMQSVKQLLNDNTESNYMISSEADANGWYQVVDKN